MKVISTQTRIGSNPRVSRVKGSKQVMMKFAVDNKVTLQESARVFRKMMAYLRRAAGTPVGLSPEPDVDKMWHTFILFTREYSAFCHSKFGRFIHHVPNVEKLKRAL